MLRNISRTGLRTARSFKPQIVAKRFSHGDHHGEKHGHDDHHHDDHHHEYPPEYLFKKTSIFVGVFSVGLATLLWNDRLNSKDGKSLVGNWLIPSSDRAAIEAAEDAKVEQYLKAREDKIAERKPIPQSPFKDYSIMPVPEPGPRSVAVGNVVEFEDISERRTRSTY